MTEKIALNDGWFYTPNCNVIKDNVTVIQDSMEEVRIPHTNIELPYNYFDESIYQFVSCYKKDLGSLAEYKDKRIFITFDGVAHIAKVFLNGKYIGEHKGGYTSFTFELTEFISDKNILTVEVDSREINNIPPFGKVIDYMTYGGIYREVWLEVHDQSFIQDIFVRTQLEEKNKATLSVDLEWAVPEGKQQDHSVQLFLRKDKTNEWKSIGKYETNTKVSNYTGTIDSIELWDLNKPQLYWLKAKVTTNENLVDEKQIRFGFRSCEFRKDGFYLNNHKVKLIGLNRHQSYPYVGYAMPKRAQEFDVNVLKNELGVNAVRTSHYPQSQHFINRCDELGLLVFTEIPGWQHIGDSEWKECALSNVKEMILQYRNHPSIILWGVRINESADDDDFYKKTNQLAHELDNSRQTGGVRCFKRSNLLEDVYTYNDFSHNGKTPGLEPKKAVTSNKEAPYLVTECNGHMFPTKSFDTEEHRLEHAKRHMAVMESLFFEEDIAGMFGWCMFDYNTHQDFGSGDRICYHGVMTMFRNPKLAASVYASQSNIRNVCEITSNMDIGEHPGAYLGEVMAITNADSIKLYKNDKFIKEFYPDSKRYGHMIQPPIIIDDFIGDALVEEEGFSYKNAERMKELLRIAPKYGVDHLPLKYLIMAARVVLQERFKLSDGVRLFNQYVNNWGGEVTRYRFDAIKDGNVVKSITKEPVKKVYLNVVTDTNELVEADTYDVASIRIKAVDENGIQLPYYQEVINLEVTGPVQIIGPSRISLKGGAIGTYIKSIGKEGNAELTISAQGVQEVKLPLQVRIGECNKCKH